MKHLGVYIGVQPREGGAYQYTLALLGALRTLDPAQYSVTCFFIHERWNELLPDSFTKVYAPRGFFRKALNKIYSIATGNRWLAWHFPHFFHPILKAMEKSRCDLILYPAQDPFAYQCRKPALTTIHDLMHRYEPHYEEYQNGEFELRERHYKATCARAAGILVDSELGKRQVVESYGADPAKVLVLPFIPPGYLDDAKPVNVREKYSLPNRFFFYPAQFWEHKNHLNLLAALAILRKKVPQASLVLVGSAKGNYDKAMQKIEELGLKDAVKVLGYVSNDEMYSLYREAEALVFVSLIGPTNIPPLEGMATGCPVIVSNTYAMPEQAGGAALLVDPRNPESIAAAMEKIWTDPAERNRLKERGLARARGYGLPEFARTLESHIRTALEI